MFSFNFVASQASNTFTISPIVAGLFECCHIRRKIRSFRAKRDASRFGASGHYVIPLTETNIDRQLEETNNGNMGKMHR
jgi:hypothetical protein